MSPVLTEHLEEIACTVNEVVGFYAKRTGYWYDERDLAQKAWLVALELSNRGTWSPEKGPLAPYLARALRLQLGGELVHDHAPVSAARAERYALYSIERSPLKAVAERIDGRPNQPGESPQHEVEASVDTPQTAEDLVGDEAWLRRVHYRMIEVVGEEGAEGLQDLLRDGPRPAHSGCPSDRLTESRAVACVRIAQDAELRELLLEKDH